MDRRNLLLKRAPLIGGSLLAIVFVLGLVWLIRGVLAHKNDQAPRMVQNITLIRPPPPPPEAPPPPPPEKVEEQVPQNQPDPTPDNTPSPSEQLGLDADGAAGGDGFGLAARKGGGDLIGTGGAAFAWYTGRLKDEITEQLTADAAVRKKSFSVIVRVWISPDGRVKDVRLVNSTGNRELDSSISAALGALGRLKDSPPLEMPQPISLKIVSRAT